MIVEHLVFLVHPLCYEALYLDDDDAARAKNVTIYVEREREAKRRWLSEMERFDDTSVLHVLGHQRSPTLDSLLSAARSVLGDARVCYVDADRRGRTDMRA